MATYVAVRVDDQYVLQHKPVADEGGLALLAGGSIAAVWGALRGGWLGLALFGLGLSALSGSLLGVGPLKFPFLGRPKPIRSSGSPSHQHDRDLPAQQKPTDEVEEASMESFPASDAPTFTQTTFPR